MMRKKDGYFWDDYFDKLFKIFDECIRVLKYGGRIIVNIQPLFQTISLLITLLAIFSWNVN